MTKKKIGVISLGCDKNRVDTEYMLGVISGSSYELTSDIDKADVVVINTCAFLAASRSEAVDTIMECNEKRASGVEKIVVTGCLSQKYIDEIFDDLTEADIFLGTKDYALLPAALDRAYAGERINLVGKGGGEKPLTRIVSTPKSYAYLKISEGCDNKCTYCLIPKIRGAYVSEPEEQLINEAKSLGIISELILVAQDITRYGCDLKSGESLCRLITKLTQLGNIMSVRLLYCYPDMIDDELISVIKNNPKVVKYLDIPLQHTEDRILKLMNRQGSRKGYLELIKTLKREVDGIALRTTFITGFPSETEAEHSAMLSFLEEAQLFNAGFFAYSREEETPAYNLKGQLSEALKQKRIEKLYEKQTQIATAILTGYVGKTLDVLCDSFAGKQAVGRAYFSAPDIDTYVQFECNNPQVGKVYKVKILRCENMTLYGEER